jgi:nucleotide-binding universal stress UspA family protein
MSKTILIPTDFSKVCDNAINHGAEIAKSMGARLFILHVLNTDSAKYLKKNGLSRNYVDEQLAYTKTQLEKAYDINVQTFIIEGKFLQAIADFSTKIHADLVVLGTHGKTGIQKITGSHAMKVVHALDIPVLVVQKRTFGMGYRKIIFPINISTDYDIKIDWTVFIAQAFRAQVFIFTMKTEHKETQKALDNLVENITTRFADNQINYSVEHATKTVGFAHQINDFAVSNSADLVMIKVDNDEFEPSFILGAQEEKMIFNSSQIPVFCAQKK